MASRRNRGDGGLVWDSQFGATCPGCGQPEAACACVASEAPAGDGSIRVELSRKGRGGKVVTVVRGVPLSLAEVAALAKELKKRCGAGGRVDGAVIEIQGDRRAQLVEDLRGRGFVVKSVG